MRRTGLAPTVLVLVVLASDLASSDTTRTIPLRYSPVLGNGNFPSPAARVTVNGQHAWFLMDTGAGVHVIASWLVDAAELKVDAAFGEKVRGVDSTGRPYAFRGVHDLAARLDDGSELSLPIAAVADFPPDFRQFEIGGILSPQLLAGESQAAALDLRVPELRIGPFDIAVQRLGAHALPRDQLEVCGSTKDPVPNLLFAIRAVAAGGKGTVLVDSGAGATSLRKKTALVRGVRLVPGGQTTGLAGKPQQYRLARGLEMTFGDHRTTVDARVVDEGRRRCGADGLLGVDALRACAVVLAEHDLAITCSKSH